MLSIVTTTINVPFFLNGLIKNLSIYNNLKKTNIVVIGDKKTPSETLDYINKFRNKILQNDKKNLFNHFIKYIFYKYFSF